jgi:hypothetical protein
VEAAVSFFMNKRWIKVQNGGLSLKRKKNLEAALEFPLPILFMTKVYPLL